MNRLRKILAYITLSWLGACSQQPALQGATIAMADFSGLWEMDYRRTDRVNEKIRGLYHEIQRTRERQPSAAEINASMGQRARLGVGSSEPINVDGVIDLARLADYITRGQLLEIEQIEDEINIVREDTFNLNCVFSDGEAKPVADTLGAEVCGWDGHQLVFKIFLSDGLNIVHRLTIAADAELLNVATTVSSKRSRYPFTLNRVYLKFEKLNDGISCQMTLTKGRVCTTESS